MITYLHFYSLLFISKYDKFTIGGFMKCYKCGVTISDTDKYCPRCGTLFDNGDVEKHTDNFENQLLNFYTNKILGANYRISLGYLIFNFSYAFYKKMYREGIIGFIFLCLFYSMLSGGLEFIVDSMGFYFLLFLFIIVGGLVYKIYYIWHFNDLYIRSAKYRIQKIINQYGIKNKEVIKKICEKDSRGNIIVAILSMLLFIFLAKYSL